MNPKAIPRSILPESGMEVFAEIGPVDIADVRQHERTDDDERRRRDGGNARDGTDERAEE